MKTLDVLDSFMSYREAGPAVTGASPARASNPHPTAASLPPVVFLHGNPTSSHLWRNVMPRVPARSLAPDLIGMGDSGKPELAYRLADHVRYLDAWIDGMKLDELVLVGIDWGGVLALDWAARHPSRVRGVSVMETFLRPARWDMFPPRGAELFRAYRTPGVGERMVLEENLFLLHSLEHGARNLSAADRDVYYAPYPTPASRRPLLAWPREVPIDGEPPEVQAVLERFADWLCVSETPKQLITFEPPASLSSPAMIAWAKENVRALDHVALGSAGHHAPEDRPAEIGDAVASWLVNQVCGTQYKRPPVMPSALQA